MRQNKKGGILIKPKVSIIIPVYNVEHYIRRCIESIILQKDFSSFEVIIIDDGTKDNSIEVINDLISMHPNIILVHQENSGLSEARNTGIRMAKGEYISFIDSDDWIESDMISAMYLAAEETKSEVAVCNIRVVFEKNEEIKREIKHGFKGNSVISSRKVIEHFFAHQKINGQVCNKIYRTELFKEFNVYFPVGKNYEDLSTCFHLIWNANHVVFLNEYFYNYLQRKGSITKMAELNFWHKIENVYLIQDFLISKDVEKQYAEKFLMLLIIMLFGVYVHLEKHKKGENYSILKKKLNEELKKINLKEVTLSNNLPGSIRLKLIIMKFRMEPMINILLKMKNLKSNTTM